MEHLFNSFLFGVDIWGHVSDLFHKIDKNLSNILQTIKNWSFLAFHNLLINEAWIMLPGLLLWLVWKNIKFVFFDPHPPMWINFGFKLS